MRPSYLLLVLSGGVSFAPVRQHCPAGSDADCASPADLSGADNKTACVPKTCADFSGGYCGTPSDRCVGTLTCTCAAPAMCGAEGTVGLCSAITSLSVTLDNGVTSRARAQASSYTLTVTNVSTIAAETSVQLSVPAQPGPHCRAGRSATAFWPLTAVAP